MANTPAIVAGSGPCLGYALVNYLAAPGYLDFVWTCRAMVRSAVHLAHAVLPGMMKRGFGAFVVSGALTSLQGGHDFAAFATAKAGLRALARSLAQEYGSKGLHLAHIVLDGILDTGASRTLYGMAPARMMQSQCVAAACLPMAQQPEAAWTHDLDLHPMGEAF